jgi:hypothetical protein
MGSKTKFDPGRRDFLKKTTRGIAGAAAATAFPGGTGGGIMETEAAKQITNAPYNYNPLLDIIKSKGTFSSKDGLDVYELGKFKYEEYNPGYEEVTSGGLNMPEGQGKLTITEQAMGSYTTPDGESELFDYEIPSYEIDFNPQVVGEPTEPGEPTFIDQEKSIDFTKDFYYSSSGPEDAGDLEADFFDTLKPNEIPKEDVEAFDDYLKEALNLPPERGSREFEDNQRKKENQKLIQKDKKLPAKKEGLNLKGLVKGLSKRLPPARVINVLQLLSQGLDLYEAINQAMGLPSKEEFDQVVKDMQESEFANGGIATLGV